MLQVKSIQGFPKEASLVYSLDNNDVTLLVSEWVYNDQDKLNKFIDYATTVIKKRGITQKYPS